MSDALAKEKMSAFQRWEMDSFDPQDAKKVPLPVGPAVSEEEIKRITEAARQEGFTAGYTDGLSQGRAEGADEVKVAASALHSLLVSASSELATMNDALATDVLDLSLHISRALVKTAFVTKPELILPVIKECMDLLPATPAGQHKAILFVNQRDMEMVEKTLGTELHAIGWSVRVDSSLSVGSCRVSSETNDLDATMETRWQRLMDALAKDTPWDVV